MAHLIDKDALVAEIKNRRDGFYALSKSCKKGTPAKAGFYAQAQTLEGILSLLDTLEVKDGDLEIEQRMKKCPYRKVGCTMYKDKVLECKGACCWVVDYLKLKELKAQKGEKV